MIIIGTPSALGLDMAEEVRRRLTLPPPPSAMMSGTFAVDIVEPPEVIRERLLAAFNKPIAIFATPAQDWPDELCVQPDPKPRPWVKDWRSMKRKKGRR